VLARTPVFATAINCIDGRTHLPLIGWMREALAVDYVDLVTEPGADRVLALEARQAANLIRPRVELSVERHAPVVVAIAAHHDCLGNPVSEAEHRQMLHAAVHEILGWRLGVKVMALWIDERWQVDVVMTRV
jgi:hypothetical protein